jgi:branched-chain amino acid transport system substrate-binding protein
MPPARHIKKENTSMGTRLVTAMLLVVLLAVFIGLPSAACAKDKIILGVPIAMSGPYAEAAIATVLRNYELWVEDVNAKGGVYVKELDKRLPVELIKYDDKSDPANCIKLAEKLMVEDKVDLFLAPWGTGYYLAVAPVANKHGYPIIASAAAVEQLRPAAHTLPYAFALHSTRDQAKALVDLLAELGVKKAAVIFPNESHGTGWVSMTVEPMVSKGIQVAVTQSYSRDTKDLTTILQAVKDANVDALLAFTYPRDTELVTEQAKSIGLNPKLLYLSIGGAYAEYRDKFGSETVEGIMALGAWNPKVPYPGAKEYFAGYVKRWGKEPDRYTSPASYAAGQILEQAIEKVGSLDRKKLRDCIASETFQTIIGPVKFEGIFNVLSCGEIGQWQKGEFEVVAAKDKRTAQPIYPKPLWK